MASDCWPGSVWCPTAGPAAAASQGGRWPVASRGSRRPVWWRRQWDDGWRSIDQPSRSAPPSDHSTANTMSVRRHTAAPAPAAAAAAASAAGGGGGDGASECTDWRIGTNGAQSEQEWCVQQQDFPGRFSARAPPRKTITGRLLEKNIGGQSLGILCGWKRWLWW